MRRHYIVIIILLLVASFTGRSLEADQPPAPHPGDKITPTRDCVIDDNVDDPWQVLGYSVECRPILAVTRGRGDESVLLLGAFHGGERMTGPFIERFDKKVAAGPGAISDKRRVVIVPYLNPDGWAANTRVNARGVDINRNFPTRNWRARPVHYTFPPGPYPASEPETRVIMDLIEFYKPLLIVSVHSPLKMINYDGPARGVARKMSKISGLRLRRYVGYPTPGSLGTYAGKERNIPTITLELPDEKDMEKYYGPVMDALIFAINM